MPTSGTVPLRPVWVRNPLWRVGLPSSDPQPVSSRWRLVLENPEAARDFPAAEVGR